jgi:hypothetical protein
MGDGDAVTIGIKCYYYIKELVSCTSNDMKKHENLKFYVISMINWIYGTLG